MTHPADRTVVVGIDGGPTGAAALAWAIEYASRRNLAVELVHASGVGPRTVDLLDEAEDLALDAGVPVVSWTVESRPAGPLLIEASERSALVVVGSRGTGVILGRSNESVGRHVARFASCSVAVVPREPSSGKGDVTVMLDGGPGDQVALQFAFGYAAMAGFGVEAVHAWQEPLTDPLTFSPLADGALSRHLEASAILLAEDLAGYRAVYPDVRVHVRSAPTGLRPELACAAENAELLVLPALRGGIRGPEAHDPMSQAVLRHARCPVVYTRS